MSINIDAVILAGGRAQRMGGEDKGLVELNGIPMIQYAINRIKPQVNKIFINANRHHQQYQQLGFDVFDDENTDFNGPLAGIVCAMKHTKADYLLSAPCDCPLLPLNLVDRMHKSLELANADIAVATDGENMQPVIMLLKPFLKDSMQAFLDRGDRKIILWYQNHNVVEVPFNNEPMAFININTPEQKALLAATLNDKNQ